MEILPAIKLGVSKASDFVSELQNCTKWWYLHTVMNTQSMQRPYRTWLVNKCAVLDSLHQVVALKAITQYSLV